MTFKTYNFGVAIVRNNKGEYLAVKETKDRGWWLPAGRIEPGETFEAGTIRECLEEGGVKIALRGILRVERTVFPDYARMRVIYYAEPDPPEQKAKDFADKESEYAQWVKLDEYKKFENLRGDELVVWGDYLENGGTVYPLSLLALEKDDPSPGDKAFTVKGKAD